MQGLLHQPRNLAFCSYLVMTLDGPTFHTTMVRTNVGIMISCLCSGSFFLNSSSIHGGSGMPSSLQRYVCNARGSASKPPRSILQPAHLQEVLLSFLLSLARQFSHNFIPSSTPQWFVFLLPCCSASYLPAYFP